MSCSPILIHTNLLSTSTVLGSPIVRLNSEQELTTLASPFRPSVPLICCTRTLPITPTMKPSSPAPAFTLPQIFLFLLCLPLALAQFGNFFQQGFPFGNQHHQQQQPQEGGRAHKGWQEMDSGMSSHRYTFSRLTGIDNGRKKMRTNEQ
jgi:hypothetical protein